MILACLLLFAVYYACEMGSDAEPGGETVFWYVVALLVFVWSIALAISSWIRELLSSEMAMLSVLYFLLFFTLWKCFKRGYE